MNSFINDNFLLETDYARELYHNYAKGHRYGLGQALGFIVN